MRFDGDEGRKATTTRQLHKVRPGVATPALHKQRKAASGPGREGKDKGGKKERSGSAWLASGGVAVSEDLSGKWQLEFEGIPNWSVFS